MPDPAQPSPFHAHSLSTLTEDPIISSWTYSSPYCTRDPAQFPVDIKASHQCTVDLVQISTKLATKSWPLLVSKVFSITLWSGILWTSAHSATLCYTPRNPRPNNSRGAAHKLKPGLSVHVISGTPTPPGSGLAHPVSNVKGIPWNQFTHSSLTLPPWVQS